MADAPVTDISVEPLPDGVRIDLPRRDLGKARWGGLIPLAAAAFIVVFMLFWMGGPIGVFLASKQPGLGEWLALGFGLLGLPGLLMAVVPIFLGLAIFAGRGSIVLSKGRLRHIEYGGPLRWTWSRKVSGLTRLVIGREPVKVNDQVVTSGPLAELAALRAEFQSGKPMMLAIGYPRATLTSVAQTIASACARSGATQPDLDSLRGSVSAFKAAQIPVEVTMERAEVERRTPVRQPANSACAVERRDDGLTLTIPPAGFFKGSKGLGVFSLLWCGFIVVFTGAALRIPLVGGKPITTSSGGTLPVWVIPLFLLLFWTAGIGTFLAALNMGRRRAVLDVVADTLVVTEQSIFRTRQREWTRKQVSDIRVGPSGMRVNDRPVLQVQIHLAAAGKVGLFTGRDEPELYWLASELYQALALTPTPAGT